MILVVLEERKMMNHVLYILHMMKHLGDCLEIFFSLEQKMCEGGIHRSLDSYYAIASVL